MEIGKWRARECLAGGAERSGCARRALGPGPVAGNHGSVIEELPWAGLDAGVLLRLGRRCRVGQDPDFPWLGGST